MSAPAVIRHITPGLGSIPRFPDREACSGVVGAALGIAQAQADMGKQVQLLGWNPVENSCWHIGDVEIRATSGWRRAYVHGFDFRIVAPLLSMSRSMGPVDVLHVYADPHLLLAPGAGIRVLHLQTPTDHVPRTWKRLLRRATSVVCCSQFIKDQFLERTGYPPDQTFVVHNGVDTRRFSEDSRQDTRRQLGIADDAVVVLFAGAIVPEKGLVEMLTAVSRLSGELAFEVLVAGGASMWPTPGTAHGDSGQAYMTQARNAAGNASVRWLGTVARDAMAALYGAADVLVVPSVWDEPFGMVACEAMAAGTPVIASKVGGLPEIVSHNETGLLVPARDIEALASAIRLLIENSSLRHAMGCASRERAALFSWSRAADLLDPIYRNISVDLPATTPITSTHGDRYSVSDGPTRGEQ